VGVGTAQFFDGEHHWWCGSFNGPQSVSAPSEETAQKKVGVSSFVSLVVRCGRCFTAAMFRFSARLSAAAFACSLFACQQGGVPTTPVDRFYYPSGIGHVPSAGTSNGVLFVANGNFDKRYLTGSISAVNLDALGLPSFGDAVPPSGPKAIYDLKTSEQNQVRISSFAGQMAVWPVGADQYRIFVPSRSEGMRFQAVDAEVKNGAVTLKCRTGNDQSKDCGSTAPSLVANQTLSTGNAPLVTTNTQNAPSGIPRAPSPFGVAVQRRRCEQASDCKSAAEADNVCINSQCVVQSTGEPLGDVWVTHLVQADSPEASAQNFRAYLVRLPSDARTVADNNFVSIGFGASDSVAPGKRWNFISGRFLSSNNVARPNLVRLLSDKEQLLENNLQSAFQVSEGRGIVLSPDEKRLYLASRSPDVLMVFNIDDSMADAPTLTLVRQVPLPNGPTALALIPREGQRELVAVTCTNAGSIAFYDDDVGNVVGEVNGIGLLPFALTVDFKGVGARIYVSNFGDGRVAVVDLPNLKRPQNARLVALLGASQLCLLKDDNSLPGCIAGVSR
jgi:hypothetical protein